MGMKNRCFYNGLIIALLGFFLLSGCDMLGLSGDDKKTSGSYDSGGESGRVKKAKPKKKVLVLHSYHAEYAWMQDVNKGILSGFLEERFEPKKNMTVDYFYMDTKRKTSAVWKKEIAQKAIQRINQWKPDVVIATDDNAQMYVVSKMKDTKVPFVFLGVNADPMKYGYIDTFKVPGHNVTGCLERERFEQTMLVLRRLYSNINKLAVICDDGPTGTPIIGRVKELAPKLGIELVAVKQTGRFPEWKKFVQEQQSKADALLVIVYHTLKDKNGNHVHEDTVLNWTVSNSRIPDIGFWSWAVDAGLLCSEAISGYQQGHYAATVASYILMGQSAGEFPVNMPRRGETCINQARAEQLGVKIPPDLLKTATIFKNIKSAR